jgi:leucyl-tRNA synthetase
MEGHNVLFPIGWDAFGLPTENYAIKTKQHPMAVTKKNTDNFRRQLKSAGFSFDWAREVNTTDPKYYKWTQWIFLQLYKHGLAYKKKMVINWCPKDKIGLANEEVVNGCCERCGTAVEKREKEQWMLAITKYADRLDRDLDTVNYLEKIKIQQRNWIGRSEGVNFKEKVKDLDIEFEVYDSIPQTFLAQTFTVIAPEHPMVRTLVQGTPYEKEVMEFVAKIAEKKRVNKFDIEHDMEGIFTGRYVDNPFGTGDFPIWIASYVLADYGTGIVNCSAHDARDFAFAKKIQYSTQRSDGASYRHTSST